MDKKNILLIVTDEERIPMHFPAGLEFPARALLRERGVSFQRYHVNTAPCTPSRSVIFTGLHTPRNRMVDNTSIGYIKDLDPDIPTLGDMLASAGYYSVYKGKWHLASITPSEDPRHTTEHDMEPYGFRDYQHYGDLQSSAREGYCYDSLIVEDALHWLHHWIDLPTDKSSQPFFLTVALVNPHDIMIVDVDGTKKVQYQPEGGGFMPIMTPPEHALYQQDHSPVLPRSWSADFNREHVEAKPAAHHEFDLLFRYNFGDIPRDEALWKRYVNYYINCMLDVDRHIARLLQHLDDTGLIDNTIVVFTADHGEMGGAHGLRTKGPWIYREGLNVPLVICHPDGPSGVTTEALGCALDLAPTLMGLAGMSAEQQQAAYPDLRGYDLSGLALAPDSTGPRSEILFTYTSLSTLDGAFVSRESESFDPSKRGLLLGIHDGRYKYARYFSPLHMLRPSSHEELLEHFDLEIYDTQDDPDELHNLASDAASQELVQTMNAKLDALVDRELGGTCDLVELPANPEMVRGLLT